MWDELLWIFSENIFPTCFNSTAFLIHLKRRLHWDLHSNLPKDQRFFHSNAFVKCSWSAQTRSFELQLNGCADGVVYFWLSHLHFFWFVFTMIKLNFEESHFLVNFHPGHWPDSIKKNCFSYFFIFNEKFLLNSIFDVIFELRLTCLFLAIVFFSLKFICWYYLRHYMSICNT